MVLLQAVAAGALVPTQSQPQLQTILVWCIVISIGAVSTVVLSIIIFFALKRPAYLFSPSDIDPSAHGSLYGSVADSQADRIEPEPHEDAKFIAYEDSSEDVD